MVLVKNKDIFHINYNKDIYIELDIAIKKLHNAFNKRSEFIYIIDKYKNYYNSVNININSIYDINLLKKISLPDTYKNLDELKISFIKGYNNITIKVIPELLHNIKLYNSIKKMPKTIFNAVQEEYNNEICNYILKGNRFKLGENLGALKLKFYKRPENGKRHNVNWNESIKLKNELLNAGYTLYSKDNPSGTPYILYYDSDITYSLFWDRRNIKLQHRYFYKFLSNFNNNIAKSKVNPKTIEDVYNNKGLGLTEKLRCIMIYFPETIKQLIK